MFEDMIVQLEAIGVTPSEDMEAGTLSISVSDVDKVTLIEIIRMLNDSGMEFTIDETSIMVQGTPMDMDMGMDDMMMEDDADMQELALDEAMLGM
jgi:hypothetical protein